MLPPDRKRQRFSKLFKKSFTKNFYYFQYFIGIIFSNRFLMEILGLYFL